MGFSSYVIENDRAFKEALKKAGQEIGDLRVPFGLISRDFYRSEKAIFQLKSAGLYPPFKETDGVSKYRERKIKKYGFDYPLLLAKGPLSQSVLGPNNPGSINIITKLSLTIGTSIKYGIFHQSDEPRSKIPLRKFLFIGPEAPRFATSDQMGRAQRWLGYISDYTKKKLQPLGA